MSDALSTLTGGSVPAGGVAQRGGVKSAIAVTVAFGAMLEVICRNAVGITLPFIQGNLMATAGEVGWVLANYSVAGVVIIPLVAWLAGRVSRKTCFLGSLCVFTLGSILCGLASTPSMLITARVLQGLGGGAILASGQSILVQNFSRKKAQGVAQTAFVLVAFLGGLIGPVLGIYLTDNYSWRLPFHLSVLCEFVVLILAAILLPRDTAPSDATPCVPRTAGDGIGLLFMIIALASLQIILERGPEDHWFASHLITAAAVTCLLSSVAFVGWELRVESGQQSGGTPLLLSPPRGLRALCASSRASGSLYPILLGAGLFIAFYILPDFAGGNPHSTAIHTGEWLILVRWALVSQRPSSFSGAEPVSARTS